MYADEMRYFESFSLVFSAKSFVSFRCWISLVATVFQSLNLESICWFDLVREMSPFSSSSPEMGSVPNIPRATFRTAGQEQERPETVGSSKTDLHRSVLDLAKQGKGYQVRSRSTRKL